MISNPIYGKIRNAPNHQPVIDVETTIVPHHWHFHIFSAYRAPARLGLPNGRDAVDGTLHQKSHLRGKVTSAAWKRWKRWVNSQAGQKVYIHMYHVSHIVHILNYLNIPIYIYTQFLYAHTHTLLSFIVYIRANKKSIH